MNRMKDIEQIHHAVLILQNLKPKYESVVNFLLKELLDAKV